MLTGNSYALIYAKKSNYSAHANFWKHIRCHWLLKMAVMLGLDKTESLRFFQTWQSVGKNKKLKNITDSKEAEDFDVR